MKFSRHSLWKWLENNTWTFSLNGVNRARRNYALLLTTNNNYLVYAKPLGIRNDLKIVISMECSGNISIDVPRSEYINS